MNANKTVILAILDGWGHRPETEHNAIAAAATPNFDRLWQAEPHALLAASGPAVGLPPGQMGNSEVGHMTIGAGRPIDTELVRIDRAIASGEFDQNPAFLALFEHVRKNNSTLHIQGLVSPGGVHSHEHHLFAFLRLAKKANLRQVAVHVFTDGRDTPPQSASTYLKELEALLAELGPNFFIATVSGRYYAMDRDNNWDRLAKVERALFECRGQVCEVKPSVYLETQYQDGQNDELLAPTVCATPEGLGCAIKPGDGIFFFNFRADRARMLSEKMLARPAADNIKFVTLTEYCVDFTCQIAFPPATLETTLGQEISRAGLNQAHIAETEKFAHATYFLNGGREKPYEGERDILLDSRKDVKTHDQAPAMRAEAITDQALTEIAAGTAFVFLNYANADMVGHTANVPAIIQAVETVDHELGRLASAITQAGGVLLVTADHGNAELNIDPVTGTKHTAHTTSPVPALLIGSQNKLRDGGLADIAPTILTLLGLPVPPTMSGQSLLV